MARGTWFERAVERDALGANALVRGETVVVGVSGGPDSMALLVALAELSRTGRLPLELWVAHLNHRLRGEASDRDERFVAAWARRLELPVHVEVAPGLADGGPNLEARARDVRARFLHGVASAAGARSIALGHTLDDQAETVLHRFARGGGVRALAGMEMRRADGVVRPLLGRRRAECLHYLEEKGVGFVQDESNLDARFTRNRLRHHVLPRLAADLGADVAARLAALADDLRVEADLADRQVSAWLGGAGDVVPIAAVSAAGAAAGRVVHAWLGSRGVRPTRKQVAAIVRLASGASPSAGVDLGGLRVERRYEVLALCGPLRRPATGRDDPTATARRWTIPGTVDLPTGWRLTAEAVADPRREGGGAVATDVVLDAAAVGAELAVRVRRPGDRIRVRAGHRKLSDVLVDRRVPRRERDRLAVVARGADIVWVPGVAVAFDALPAASTERCVRLAAQRADCRGRRTVVEMQGFWVQFG